MQQQIRISNSSTRELMCNKLVQKRKREREREREVEKKKRKKNPAWLFAKKRCVWQKQQLATSTTHNAEQER